MNTRTADIEDRKSVKPIVDIRLGVCVLFYEKLDQTIECLQSFLSSGVNIYVLNNGSSMSSREALGKFCADYEQIKIVDSDINLGPACGRNYLVTHTTEEWLLFVDNDIVVRTPDWVRRIASHVSAHKDIEVFIPRLFIAHEDRYSPPLALRINGNRVIYDSKTVNDTTNAFPDGASFINRRLFDRLGLYDEKMFAFEAFELCIRGILSRSPVKARRIRDIELVHEHRPARKEADKRSVLLRYDRKLLEASFDRIVKKHNVALPSDWQKWADGQRERILMRKVVFREVLKKRASHLIARALRRRAS